jgi:putative NADH-flavin reductase
MSTIALFGATGKTGRRVLTRALEAGHDVRALVRDPARLDPAVAASDRLTIVTGDVLDPTAVDRTIEGSEAVLALFGQVKGSPATLQADGVRLIAGSMQRHGVRRIVTLSGGGLRDDANDRPKLADRLIRGLLQLLSGHVLADAEAHLDVLRGTDLDWTVVRGPRLTEQPGHGSYRVGWVGVGTGTQISRDDLAHFVLVQVDDRRFLGAMPFVSA